MVRNIYNDLFSKSYQLLAVVGLDKVDPLGDLHLARLLEMGSQGDGEVLLADVLYRDRRHCSEIL